jgi:hypothetical protein
MADYIIDYDTTIDYTIIPDVSIVEGTNPNPPTIVDIVEPAVLDGDRITVKDSSILNVYGGNLDLGDDGVEAIDSSTVNFFGGEIFDEVGAYGHSTINVYDGLFRGHHFSAEEWGTLNIFGGTIEAEIHATEKEGQVHIHGGNILRLEVGEWCQITVYGTGFNYPYGPIPDNAGVLTGVLASGQPINAEFNIDKTYSEDVSIVLAVPEPSTLVMLATSAVGLSFVVRRHLRRPGHSRKPVPAIPKKVAT